MTDIDVNRVYTLLEESREIGGEKICCCSSSASLNVLPSHSRDNEQTGLEFATHEVLGGESTIDSSLNIPMMRSNKSAGDESRGGQVECQRKKSASLKSRSVCFHDLDLLPQRPLSPPSRQQRLQKHPFCSHSTQRGDMVTSGLAESRGNPTKFNSLAVYKQGSNSSGQAKRDLYATQTKSVQNTLSGRLLNDSGVKKGSRSQEIFQSCRGASSSSATTRFSLAEFIEEACRDVQFSVEVDRNPGDGYLHHPVLSAPTSSFKTSAPSRTPERVDTYKDRLPASPAGSTPVSCFVANDRLGYEPSKLIQHSTVSVQKRPTLSEIGNFTEFSGRHRCVISAEGSGAGAVSVNQTATMTGPDHYGTGRAGRNTGIHSANRTFTVNNSNKSGDLIHRDLTGGNTENHSLQPVMTCSTLRTSSPSSYITTFDGKAVRSGSQIHSKGILGRNGIKSGTRASKYGLGRDASQSRNQTYSQRTLSRGGTKSCALTYSKGTSGRGGTQSCVQTYSKGTSGRGGTTSRTHIYSRGTFVRGGTTSSAEIGFEGSLGRDVTKSGTRFDSKLTSNRSGVRFLSNDGETTSCRTGVGFATGVSSEMAPRVGVVSSKPSAVIPTSDAGDTNVFALSYGLDTLLDSWTSLAHRDGTEIGQESVPAEDAVDQVALSYTTHQDFSSGPRDISLQPPLTQRQIHISQSARSDNRNESVTEAEGVHVPPLQLSLSNSELSGRGSQTLVETPALRSCRHEQSRDLCDRQESSSTAATGASRTCSQCSHYRPDGSTGHCMCNDVGNKLSTSADITWQSVTPTPTLTSQLPSTSSSLPPSTSSSLPPCASSSTSSYLPPCASSSTSSSLPPASLAAREIALTPGQSSESSSKRSVTSNSSADRVHSVASYRSPSQTTPRLYSSAFRLLQEAVGFAIRQHGEQTATRISRQYYRSRQNTPRSSGGSSNLVFSSSSSSSPHTNQDRRVKSDDHSPVRTIPNQTVPCSAVSHAYDKETCLSIDTQAISSASTQTTPSMHVSETQMVSSAERKTSFPAVSEASTLPTASELPGISKDHVVEVSSELSRVAAGNCSSLSILTANENGVQPGNRDVASDVIHTQHVSSQSRDVTRTDHVRSGNPNVIDGVHSVPSTDRLPSANRNISNVCDAVSVGGLISARSNTANHMFDVIDTNCMTSSVSARHGVSSSEPLDSAAVMCSRDERLESVVPTVAVTNQYNPALQQKLFFPAENSQQLASLQPDRFRHISSPVFHLNSDSLDESSGPVRVSRSVNQPQLYPPSILLTPLKMRGRRLHFAIASPSSSSEAAARGPVLLDSSSPPASVTTLSTEELSEGEVCIVLPRGRKFSQRLKQVLKIRDYPRRCSMAGQPASGQISEGEIVDADEDGGPTCNISSSVFSNNDSDNTLSQ